MFVLYALQMHVPVTYFWSDIFVRLGKYFSPFLFMSCHGYPLTYFTEISRLLDYILSYSIHRGAWAIFLGAQPTEQPRRDSGGG